MPLIELKLGFATVQHVNNVNWSFECDRAGRFVCDVTDDKAAEIILAVEHYRVVEPLDAAPILPPEIQQQKPANETPEFDDADLSDQERARRDLERKMNMTDAERAAFEEAEQRAAQKKADEDAAAAKAKAEQEAADKAAADAKAKEDAAKGQPATSTITPQPGEQGDKPAITDIKGIGDKMADKLATKGITEVVQLATLSDAMKGVLDEDLKLHGAIDRDDWIGQAKALMAAQPQG